MWSIAHVQSHSHPLFDSIHEFSINGALCTCIGSWKNKKTEIVVSVKTIEHYHFFNLYYTLIREVY